MNHRLILTADALVNIVLGILLLAFRPALAEFLGVPVAKQVFYPTLLGAVLLGVGLALLLEAANRPRALVGLGLGGAVTINLCGGIILAAWLASGQLLIPLRGQVLLWALVAVLVVISAVELYSHLKRGAGSAGT
jgi:hypothetical protein